jgi:hypothetical protein
VEKSGGSLEQSGGAFEKSGGSLEKSGRGTDVKPLAAPVGGSSLRGRGIHATGGESVHSVDDNGTHAPLNARASGGASSGGASESESESASERCTDRRYFEAETRAAVALYARSDRSPRAVCELLLSAATSVVSNSEYGGGSGNAGGGAADPLEPGQAPAAEPSSAANAAANASAASSAASHASSALDAACAAAWPTTAAAPFFIAQTLGFLARVLADPSPSVLALVHSQVIAFTLVLVARVRVGSGSGPGWVEVGQTRASHQHADKHPHTQT